MTYKKLLVVLSILVLLVALSSINFAAEGKHKYGGVAICKGCHSNDAVGGTEYNTWKDKAHAGAYESLASDHSKEVAIKAGIEGDPQEADECLKCHVTAWECEDLREATWKKEDGVGCESCHGAGKDYMPMNIMKDHDAAVENGLLTADEARCLECHNDESPTYKEFKLKEFMDAIKHWE